MDIAHKNTDKKIKKLESQINMVYQEALSDINQKLDDFASKYKVKEAKHLQELKDGKITQDQFDNWKKGQVFQGEQWEAKRNQIISTIHNSNSIATRIINGSVINVFATNANYMSYDLEHTNGVNFGFGVYDNATVVKLIKDDPDVLPKWKINEQKDYVWNKKKVNNAVTQGIIQGERLDQITKRISEGLVAQNENTMKTFARTAMTGAQNAGRDQSLMNAKTKGINVVKQWMATLDGRTRDSHRHMDGETIKVKDIWHPAKFSNGCRYPGDPEGPPQEVYNCRCTMVGDVQDYPSVFKRYDNIDGKPIKDMTYAEWYKAKQGKDLKPLKAKPSSGMDYAKYGGKEIVDLMEKFDFDYNNFSLLSHQKEWDKVLSIAGGDVNKVEAMFEAAGKEYKDLYAKYGGKEVYDILSKYDSFDDFLVGTTSSTYNQFQKVVDAFNGDNEAIKNAIKEINALKKVQPVEKTIPKLTAEEKAQKKYEKAKADLDKIEQEIKDKGADKVFKGIWKDQNITYADYEAKKHTIEAKKQFYEAQIKSYKKEFWDQIVPSDEEGEELFSLLAKHQSLISAKNDKALMKFLEDIDLDEDDLDDVWAMFYGARKKIISTGELLDQLEEFEKNGEAFSKLLAKRNTMAQTVSDLKPKPDPSKTFSPEAYSEQRKNAALWAKNSKQADDALRQATMEAWQGASADERFAAWDYTAGSGGFNRPLRGYQGSWSNKQGVGKVDLNYEGKGEEIKDLTNLLERSTLQQDTWLQRGVETMDGMANFLGVPESTLRNATEDELKQLLIGKDITDQAFMSCGSAKGTGFSGSILNIYCPQGTQALYMEPFSRFGSGAGKNWDGVSKQSYFGSELETLLQRNTTFRVTKVEKKYGTLYIDVEVINQEPWKIKYN